MSYMFSDFDGTLTDEDQLGPIFFEIIDFLKDNNIPLIIVTGRSKSWAHFLLTHFDYLNEVISEGGGVLTVKNDVDFDDITLLNEGDVLKLGKVVLMLLSQFPKLRLTADSFGRETDRAIDLKLLDHLKIKSDVENFLIENGATFSCSNVHLNFWCGDVSKANAVKYFIKENNIIQDDCIYFGDAKNDESMFNLFNNTVGVSNIKSVLPQLTHLPKVVLKGKDKRGAYGVLYFLKNHFLK